MKLNTEDDFFDVYEDSESTLNEENQEFMDPAEVQDEFWATEEEAWWYNDDHNARYSLPYPQRCQCIHSNC